MTNHITQSQIVQGGADNQIDGRYQIPTKGFSRRGMRSREEVVTHAAEVLDAWRREWGATEAEIARAAKISVNTLLTLLGNVSAGATAPRHKHGPHRRTLNKLLDLELPPEVRDALLDVRDFETRVLGGFLKRK
jgi:hypothetical protein